MALISQESIERVREATDIVEVISAHTDLRRQGTQMMGLCPFHEERSPSFSVDPQRKVYHCFGCGVGGDVIGFVREKDGLDFTSAVELLAERYGVELQREKEDPQAEERRKRRARMGELLERTALFYSSYLWDSAEARKAREYLAGRGLEEQVLRDFGVGYAPSAWDRVLMSGQRAGFSVEELRAVGLVQRGRQGGQYDRFRERITFPIRDVRGKVVGFGARAMRSEQGAKYVNSAETDLFRKSRLLYGLERARQAIARSDRAVIVEGYTDVLALHQAGVHEAVGVMGTAITEEQIKVLSGMVAEVVLALDADSSGQEAMLRAQRVAAGRSMRLRVAAMPAGEDPAEMVAGGGGERFRELVDAAVEVEEFQVDLILASVDASSPADRDRALGEVVPVLGHMADGASRSELVRRVSDRLDIEPGVVIKRVESAPREAQTADTRAAAGPVRPVGGEAPQRGGAGESSLTSRERRERALLAMCVAQPKVGREYLERLTEEHLSSPVTVRAREWLRGHLEDPMSGLPAEDTALAALLSELVLVARRQPASEEAMELNFLQLEQRRLEDLIRNAGQEGEWQRRAELSRERAELVDRIANVERVSG